jgi:hypothetical protein
MFSFLNATNALRRVKVISTFFCHYLLAMTLIVVSKKSSQIDDRSPGKTLPLCRSLKDVKQLKNNSLCFMYVYVLALVQREYEGAFELVKLKLSNL